MPYYSMLYDSLRRYRICCAIWLSLVSVICGQDAPIPPPAMAGSAERLLMEQVAELAQAGEVDEALASLQKLYDQGAGGLVEGGPPVKTRTLTTQRFIPLRQWCQQKSRSILDQHAAIFRERYLQSVDGLADAALVSLQREKDIIETKQVVERYALSSRGNDLSLFLVDLFLERGWTLAAMVELQRVAPELLGQPVVDDQRLADALQRVLMAAAMQPELHERSLLARARKLAQGLAPARATQLLELSDQMTRWQPLPNSPAWTTFAATASRSGSRYRLGTNPSNEDTRGPFDLAVWPTWQQQLDGFSTSSDRTDASKPRVGETERGALPYHPVVVDDRLYVHELTRIRAYDLETGKPWPNPSLHQPLFDSQISTAAYVPLGYPLVGIPRGTLAIDEQRLYARMGTPVTGWANRQQVEDGKSRSYLVGLDLKRQGSMLPGFPLHLAQPEFTNSEFEGCPLVLGETLLVAIVERDNVGLRRSVIAVDGSSGEILWRSKVLASGSVEGSDRANLITHQLLTYAGGRVFYNTNLGAVACLDPLTGDTEWLFSYARIDRAKQDYPTPDRYRYRDLNPCMVAAGLVYCMPQDCAEMFALDAVDGHLAWASDDRQVADAIHILGVSGNSVLVSGDRLVWLDPDNGRVQASFPGAGTPGTTNALPSPRGLGRGALIGEQVYWPTAGEVFVFAGSMSDLENPDAPQITARMRLGSRGGAGGNLCSAAGRLIYSSPTRLMVFPR
ncbi:MAG: PQQ-binding-like beta-propeller repeat protein [Pirellulaceae bacterium]